MWETNLDAEEDAKTELESGSDAGSGAKESFEGLQV